MLRKTSNFTLIIICVAVALRGTSLQANRHTLGVNPHTCHLNINHSEPDQFKFVSHSNFNNCQFLLSCSDKYNMHTHVHTVATCMFPQGKIILLKLQFINPNFVLILYKKHNNVICLCLQSCSCNDYIISPYAECGVYIIDTINHC